MRYKQSCFQSSVSLSGSLHLGCGGTRIRLGEHWDGASGGHEITEAFREEKMLLLSCNFCAKITYCDRETPLYRGCLNCCEKRFSELQI